MDFFDKFKEYKREKKGVKTLIKKCRVLKKSKVAEDGKAGTVKYED